MRRFFQLPTLALALWAIGLVIVVLLYGLHRMRVIHPHFLWVVPLLLAGALLGLGVLIGGMWRSIRGPNRLRAVAWLLLGTGPLWLGGAFARYTVWKAEQRDTSFIAGSETLATVAVAAIADAELRWRYPHRLEGRHVIMWSDRPGDAEHVAAMDEYIERLESILGQRCRAKVHWVRGTLLGQSGRYVLGKISGTPMDTPLPPGEQLTQLDRHEAAHFVIEHLCGPDAKPPSLLKEGWAEVVQGNRPGELAARAWMQKQAGTVWTLRELKSRRWYGRHQTPVHTFGGPLVDYILRKYGGEKFFELYTTCRTTTFVNDCRRVLGVRPYQLERDYWRDVKRQVESHPAAARRSSLDSDHLAPEIDENQWQHIIQEHEQAYWKFRELMKQVRFSLQFHSSHPSGGSPRQAKVAHDWPRSRCVSHWLEDGARQSEAIVADPRLSFTLKKREHEPRWNCTTERSWFAKLDMQARRRQITVRTKHLEWGFLWGPPELLPALRTSMVTSLERIEKQGRELWRVEFESGPEQSHDQDRRSGWFLLAPDRSWMLEEYEIATIRRGEVLSTFRGMFQYQSGPEEIPLLNEFRVIRTEQSGEIAREITGTVTDYEFDPAEAEEFTPQAFGLPIEDIPDRPGLPNSVTISLVGFALSCLAGVALFISVMRSFLEGPSLSATP